MSDSIFKRSGKTATLAALIAGAVLLGACQTTGPNQAVGTLIGAAGGGLIGSQFGSGTGKLAGTALGTLIGAGIGSQIGNDLDRANDGYRQRGSWRHYRRHHHHHRHGF